MQLSQITENTEETQRTAEGFSGISEDIPWVAEPQNLLVTIFLIITDSGEARAGPGI